MVSRCKVENNPPWLLGSLAGHERPPDGLGVFEDPGLGGFVFSGRGHQSESVVGIGLFSCCGG